MGKAVLLQNPVGQITAQTDGAGNDNQTVFRQFCQTAAQLIHGNVHKARNGAQLILGRSAHVNLHRISRQRGHIAPKNSFHPLFQNIVGHETRHVYRIFCGRIRRGIGMLQLHQIGHGSLILDDLCQHLDALVHSVEAHNLGTQQTTVFGREENLYGHGYGTGIVAGMRLRMGERTEIRNLFTIEQLGIGSGCGHRQIEHLSNGSSDGAGIDRHVAIRDIVGHNASLLVGRAGQRNQCRFAGHTVNHLNGIAQRINVRIGSLHIFIDRDSSQSADSQSAILGQRGFGTHADAENHHIGFDFPLVGKHHFQCTGS